MAGEVLELFSAGAFSFWEWRPTDDQLSTHGFLQGGTLTDWLMRIHPRDQVVFSEFLDQDWENSSVSTTIDYRFNSNRQGNWIRLRHTAKRVERDGKVLISGIVELITPPHRSRTLLERMEKEMVEGETRLRDFLGGVNLLQENPDLRSLLAVLQKSLRADAVQLVRLDSRLDITGMHSAGGSGSAHSFRARALGGPLRRALGELREGQNGSGVFFLDLDPVETEFPWVVAASVHDPGAALSGVICVGYRNLHGRSGTHRFHSLLLSARGIAAAAFTREQEEKQRAEILAQLRKSFRSSGMLRLSRDLVGQFRGGFTSSCELQESSGRGSERTGWSLPSLTDQGVNAEAALARWLESGRQVASEMESCDLYHAVEIAARFLCGILDSESELELDLAPGALPVQINGSLLQELVLLLMVNARDAMPRGGRIIVGTRCPLSDNHGERVSIPDAVGPCLYVADEGAPRHASSLGWLLKQPLSPECEEALANPALYLLGSTVADLGGSIGLAEGKGPGNRICISIPVASGQLSRSSRHRRSASFACGDSVSPLEGATILLVEDEMAVRKLVRKLLEVLGCSVIEAVTGREALEMWPEIREEVSLVVSDIVMPEGVSGWDLARELHHRHPDLGILLTSGYGDRPVDHGLGDIPVIGFLQKPYTVDVLRESLERLSATGVALRS